MTMAVGTEVYNVDSASVQARGVSYTDAELDAALAGPVSGALWDDAGRSDLEDLLAGVLATDFSADSFRRIFADQPVPENWRVGEAIGEAFLVQDRNCEFPWSPRRDLKNPSASPAGTDLVGFQKMNQSSNSHRFAFGEVKTSEQEAWPPDVIDGKHGLRNQLKDLRDWTATKDALLCYLGHHAQGSTWLRLYKSAATRYLADPADVSLFGILVRDVDPKPNDLSGLAMDMASGCPSATCIELRAMYLPRQTIRTLAKRAAKAREGRYDCN